MKRYDEIKGLLLKLCKNEGLKFIEADLENKCIIYLRFDDKIVFNSGEKELVTV